MIKLLILAYDFPPYISVGALRPYSWFKYLHLFNIYPIVVTRQWQNKLSNGLDYVAPGYSDSIEIEETEKGAIIKTPFKPNLANKILLKHGEKKFTILRKFITLFYLFFQYIFPIGNTKEIYLAAEQYLENNKVDCIIASGDPFVLFKYASQLSKKFSIPWIADYRDAWVQDKSSNNRIYKKWCSVFEKIFLKNVEKIITVSTFIQKQIEQNIKNKKFEIVYNGYDPEIIEIVKGTEQTNQALSIAFAGTIYDWHPIISFLKVCNECLCEVPNFKLSLHFYGINKEQQLKDIISHNYKYLLSAINFYPRMENLKLAKELAKQNAFLLFNDYSILGTKIFDYLALKRKIILCYENDEDAQKLKENYYCIDEIETESQRLQADMIEATNSGIVVKNSQHLKKVLLELNDELKKNGFISCQSINIEQYSRVKQVEKLAEIINQVSKR